jgi:hypothetical protein
LFILKIIVILLCFSYSWGWNEKGQCCPSVKAAVVSSPSLVLFKESDKAVAVAAGAQHSLALTPDGVVLSWGANRC